MPNVSECALHMNTVLIRGVRDSSGQFYSFVPYRFFLSMNISLVRLENVHFVPQAPKKADRSNRSQPQRKRVPVYDFEIVDCKAREPSIRGFGSIGKARIIFDRDLYHAEILNVVRVSKVLHQLVVRTRITPKLQVQPGLAFQSYTKICPRGELQLTHLAVPFWLTPCDGPSNLAPLSSRPLRRLTRLDISVCITEIANLPSFSRTFAEKLQTIERLNFMPSLKMIKLYRSFWMRELPFFGHRNVFLKLLRMITSDWANASTTTVFGWEKSATTKEDSHMNGKNVFRWSSGVTLDATEIAKYVENVEDVEEMQEE